MSPITGSKPPLRPWQAITLGVAGLGVLLAVPSLMHAIGAQKQLPAPKQDLVQTTESQPWVPPAPPRPKPVAFRPAVPAAVAPAPSAPPAVLPMPAVPDAAASSPLEFAHLSRHDDRAARIIPATAAASGNGRTGKQDALSARLRPTELNGVSATRLADPELTIAQGTIIPCVDQTALDSSYPGFIKAVIPQNIYSAGGHTILIDAGSTVFGTMTRGMVNGLARQFVLWQQITTPAPDFVRIRLDSPAADALGRTGLDGTVNRHLWEKLKGALLLSTVDTGLQGAALAAANALSSRGGGSTLNFYQFQGQGDQAIASLLNSTIRIPDTLTRPQGASCSIFVARDLDFASVYTLRFRGGR